MSVIGWLPALEPSWGSAKVGILESLYLTKCHSVIRVDTVQQQLAARMQRSLEMSTALAKAIVMK